MKFKDLFFLSFRNAWRHKVSLLIALLVMVMSTSCLFSFSYQRSFEKYWDIHILRNPEFRIRNVYYGGLLDERIRRKDPTLDASVKLELIDDTVQHVMDLLSENEYILGYTQLPNTIFDFTELETEDTDWTFYLRGVPLDNKIPLVAGENLDSYDPSMKVMICPSVAYPNDENNEFTTEKQVDLSSLLGREVHISHFGEMKDTYRIIGLYDTHQTYSLGKVCYTSQQNIERINAFYYELHPEYQEERERYRNTVDYQGDNIYLMLDDMSHADEVDTYLRQHGMFLGDAVVGINTETVDQVMKICNFITLLLFVITMIVVAITLILGMLQRQKEVFIYRAIGYTKKDIIWMTLFENTCLLFLGFILSILFTQIGLILLKYLLLSHKSRLFLMNPSVDVISILLSLLLVLSIPLVVTLVLYFCIIHKNDLSVGD